MKKIIKYQIVLYVFAMFLTSCNEKKETTPLIINGNQDEEILVPTNLYVGMKSARIGIDGVHPVILEKEQLFESLAKTVSKLMTDKEFRQFIKDEANKKFDGDYDILVKNFLKDDKFVKKINKALLDNKQVQIESIVAENPRLNISIPLHLDKWDYDKKQLIVCAWRNEAFPYLNAYDSKGNSFQLSQDIDPDVPVVVIGFNERVNDKGDLEIEKNIDIPRKIDKNLKILNSPTGINMTHQNSGILNVYWDDLTIETGYEVWRSNGGAYTKVADLPQNSNSYLEANLTPNARYYYQIRGVQNGTPLAWSAPVTTVAAERFNGEQLKIKRMKFKDEASLDAVEKWASGAPEIRLRVSKGNPNNTNVEILTFGKYEPANRSDIRGVWWDKDEVIFNNWAINFYSTVATFTWKEEDWNSFVTFKINGKYEQKIGAGSIQLGGEATFNNNPGSGNIGTSTDVIFWQQKNLTYETGGFQWEFYQ